MNIIFIHYRPFSFPSSCIKIYRSNGGHFSCNAERTLIIAGVKIVRFALSSGDDWNYRATCRRLDMAIVGDGRMMCVNKWGQSNSWWSAFGPYYRPGPGQIIIAKLHVICVCSVGARTNTRPQQSNSIFTRIDAIGHIEQANITFDIFCDVFGFGLFPRSFHSSDGVNWPTIKTIIQYKSMQFIHNIFFVCIYSN